MKIATALANKASHHSGLSVSPLTSELGPAWGSAWTEPRASKKNYQGGEVDSSSSHGVLALKFSDLFRLAENACAPRVCRRVERDRMHNFSVSMSNYLSARLSRHVLSLFTVHFDETKLFAGCAKICKHSSIEDTKMSFTVT